MKIPFVFIYYAISLGAITVFSPKATCQSTGSTALDEFLVEDDKLRTAEMNATTNGTSSLPCNETKHEEFCNCELQTYLDSEDFVMVNGTAYVEAYNTSYNSSFYVLEGDKLKICLPDFLDKPNPGKKEDPLVGKYSLSMALITAIGLGISMLGLVLHLIAFSTVPELRNIPGYCMAFLCVSLLCGYTSFIVGSDTTIMESKGPCVAAAFSAYFFLLSSFLWMSIMAYDVLRSLLNATGKLRLRSGVFSFKNFYVYCLYSWGVSLLLAVIALVVDQVDGVPEDYRPKFGSNSCWFNEKKALLIFFVSPVFAVICTNVIFFGVSAYTIFTNRMQTDDTDRRNMKQTLVMYVRLAVIMGLSWIAGLLATMIDAVFLWYIYAILNSLQGLFIFLAFTCTGKVRKHFHQKSGLFGGKEMTQTRTQTFQTFFNSTVSPGCSTEGRRIENTF